MSDSIPPATQKQIEAGNAAMALVAAGRQYYAVMDACRKCGKKRLSVCRCERKSGG